MRHLASMSSSWLYRQLSTAEYSSSLWRGFQSLLSPQSSHVRFTDVREMYVTSCSQRLNANSISQEICTRFFALLCFVVVIHWLIFPYPPGLLRWHCGNLTIAPVPAKQPWWIWINTSCEIIMNDYITTTKQSTTKPCAYLLGNTVEGLLSRRPS